MVQKITCPDCKTVNEITEDELCSQCGRKLDFLKDETLFDTMSVDLQKRVQAYVAGMRSQVELATGEIALNFVAVDQLLKVTYTRPVIFGRGKKYSLRDDEFIDLTPYNAYSLGLSREHARILYIDRGYMIEDLGSSNGTLLNGELLTPKRYYPLHNGDQVSFAQLLGVFHCEINTAE
jgi:hypothetical protein